MYCDKCGGTGSFNFKNPDLLPKQCTACEGTGYELPNNLARKYSPCKPEDYARVLKRYMQLEKLYTLKDIASKLSLSVAKIKERLGEYAGEFKD